MILPSLYHVAIQAAVEASLVIMDFYEKGAHPRTKVDGSPVTEADIASSNIISQILTPTGIPIMDEEVKKAPYNIRQKWESFWCVDPLDGTKEYIKRNGEFVVNIALVKNQVPVFGIIASPVNRDMVFGGKEYGVHYTTFENLNKAELWDRLLPVENLQDPLVMISSRSHFTGISLEFVTKLEEKFGVVRYITKGSALKFFDLALGKADIYPRFAPTMEWDIAAGQAILEGLGGIIMNAETGNPLVYNKEDLYNPHFIAKSLQFLKNDKPLKHEI